MSDALHLSKETYLIVLADSHKETATLVSDLHNFDDTVIAPLVGSSVLSSILDRSFEDLYVPYVDDERYVTVEKDWLKQKYESEMKGYFDACVISAY